MNRHQKIGLFLAAAALILVTLLHGPWAGYDTEYPAPSVDIASLLEHCQSNGKPPAPELGADAVSKRFADELACVERLRPVPRALPLSEWRTQSPVLPWFGSIVHAGAAAIAILVFALLWLFLFRRRLPIEEGK